VLLKVGELARHTGLTVRTLHHYDSIGLLSASARSEAGYRLYDHADVARLHAIQALRQLGLPLAEIGSVLAGDGAALTTIVARQISALDREIEQATALRSQLGLMQHKLLAGSEPETGDWLATLQLMATYSKYFDHTELKTIFDNWDEIEAEWPPLMADVRAAMDRGVPADSLEVQPLARRWMSLMLHWMDGDFDLLERWGRMYQQEPVAQTRNGPPLDMLAYIRIAAELRLACLLRHLEMDEIERFRRVPDAQWRALGDEAAELMRRGVPPASEAGRVLARRWQGLLDQVVGGDAGIKRKLVLAHRQEPLLRAGSLLEEAVTQYLREALPDLP